MEIILGGGEMRVRDVRFDAALTLVESAQVFHWQEESGAFSAKVAGRAVRVIPRPDGFLLAGVADEADAAFWRRYFDLDRDYTALAAGLRAYPTAARAMALLPGLRVLNQPPWEALVAFILSANNNVGRIRGLVNGLIKRYGEGGFPSPERLVTISEGELRALGCGYRAPYLLQTARMVRNGFPLEALAGMSGVEAHEHLLELPGVGDKVADCVQLFGLGQRDAFPVDVWVERLMKRWFLPEARDRREIRRRAREMFGAQAGIVQQSLFHCARLGLISLEEDGSTEAV